MWNGKLRPTMATPAEAVRGPGFASGRRLLTTIAKCLRISSAFVSSS